MVFRVQPGRRVAVGRHRVGELVRAFAAVAFEAVAVGGVRRWVVGGLFGFGLAGDPLDEFGHDGEAGA